MVDGIVGPIRLNPQFQLGPHIGVFITGPLGALLGVAGYFVARGLQIPQSAQWRYIAALSIMLVAGTILAAFPSSELRFYIV